MPSETTDVLRIHLCTREERGGEGRGEKEWEGGRWEEEERGTRVHFHTTTQQLLKESFDNDLLALRQHMSMYLQ